MVQEISLLVTKNKDILISTQQVIDEISTWQSSNWVLWQSEKVICNGVRQAKQTDIANIAFSLKKTVIIFLYLLSYQQ